MASMKRMVSKNGKVTYRISVCLGYDMRGKKQVKVHTYTVNQSSTPKQQEKEALHYFLNYEQRLKNGDCVDGENQTFEEYAEEWLARSKKRLSYSTYERYASIIRNKIGAYFKNYKLTRIRPKHIEDFYETLVDDYSMGTIKKMGHILSGMFRDAIRDELISINPCKNARFPKMENEPSTLKYFTPQQSLMFLKSLDITYDVTYRGHQRIDDTKKPYYVNDYTQSHRVATQYKVFYTLSLYCGLRKGETLALHWSDINFKKREISITKSVSKTEKGIDFKKPKTATSIRVVPLPKQALPLLKEYRKEYNQLRFKLGTAWKGKDNLFIQEDGTLMGRSTPYQYFKRHLKRYNEWVSKHETQAKAENLEHLPIIALHGLRHSCATLLNYLDTNMLDISKYLGHAKCSTTMDIYAHSFEEQKRDASKRLETFLAKSM